RTSCRISCELGLRRLCAPPVACGPTQSEGSRATLSAHGASRVSCCPHVSSRQVATMLSNVHSRTAEATAAIRACHFQHDRPLLFVDPYAVHLTSPGWRMVCRHR